MVLHVWSVLYAPGYRILSTRHPLALYHVYVTDWQLRFVYKIEE